MNISFAARVSKYAIMAYFAFAGGAAARDFTPWQPAFAPYPNSVTMPDQIRPGTSGKLMWYCLDAADCPNGSRPPYEAEFRFQFFLESIEGAEGELAIAADDYFALYLNGALVPGSGQWLDFNLDADGQPVPIIFTFSAEDFELGANEFLIYACDGNPQNPILPAGETVDNANAGCPNPKTRGQHYVFVDGFVRSDAADSVNLNSGDGWEARTVVDAPEPPVLALFGLVPIVLAATRGGRGRVRGR